MPSEVGVSAAVVFLPFEFCFCFVRAFRLLPYIQCLIEKTETLHRNVQMFSLDFPSGFSIGEWEMKILFTIRGRAREGEMVTPHMMDKKFLLNLKVICDWESHTYKDCFSFCFFPAFL